MSSKDNNIEVVVKAIDEFSKALGDFHNYVQKIGVQADSTAKNVKTLSDRFSGLGAVLTGGLMKMGADLFSALENAIRNVVQLIPDLISRGQEWLDVVHQWQLETGMSAQQTSALAAVMQHLGIDTSVVDRTFAMFGKNLKNNEDLFIKLGIATRDSNGQLLDAYTILDNTRRRFAEAGEALTTTAAAQELFSRSGYKLLEYLQLSDAQWQALTQDAAAAGLVVDQATINSAERMQRTWSGFWQQINGIAVQAFAALEPTIEGFVASFTSWVRSNLDTILRFVVTVANFVLGVVGGLLGIDFGAKDAAAGLVDAAGAAEAAAGATSTLGDAASKAAAGEDKFTKAIKAQISAIDDKIKALNAQKDARDAEKEQANLETAIADARAELATLQESQVNTYGLSAAEVIKANQKRDADLAKAGQKVTDAQGKLTDWQLAQQQDAEQKMLADQKQALQDQLTAHKAAAAGIAGAIGGLKGPIAGLDSKTKGLAGAMDKFSTAANDARTAGVALANDLKVKLGQLGDAVRAVGGFIGSVLLPVLGSLWGMAVSLVGPLINVVVWLNNFLAPVGGLAGAIEHAVNPLWGLTDNLGKVGDAFATLLKGIKGFIDGLPKIPSIGIPGLAAGGVVEPRPGGTLVNVGEGGEREYIIPASKMPKYGGSGGVAPVSGGRSGSVRQVTQFVIGERVLFEFVDGVLARRGAMS